MFHITTAAACPVFVFFFFFFFLLCFLSVSSGEAKGGWGVRGVKGEGAGREEGTS